VCQDREAAVTKLACCLRGAESADREGRVAQARRTSLGVGFVLPYPRPTEASRAPATAACVQARSTWSLFRGCRGLRVAACPLPSGSARPCHHVISSQNGIDLLATTKDEPCGDSPVLLQ
jgi:hypothetical protein